MLQSPSILVSIGRQFLTKTWTWCKVFAAAPGPSCQLLQSSPSSCLRSASDHTGPTSPSMGAQRVLPVWWQTGALAAPGTVEGVESSWFFQHLAPLNQQNAELARDHALRFQNLLQLVHCSSFALRSGPEVCDAVPAELPNQTQISFAGLSNVNWFGSTRGSSPVGFFGCRWLPMDLFGASPNSAPQNERIKWWSVRLRIWDMLRTWRMGNPQLKISGELKGVNKDMCN